MVFQKKIWMLLIWIIIKKRFTTMAIINTGFGLNLKFSAFDEVRQIF
jgi:hypothetical protein